MASHDVSRSGPYTGPTSFSTTSFRDAVNHRRTVYALTDTLPPTLTDAHIASMVRDTLMHLPSAFNTQTTRCIVFVGKEHKKLWDLAAETLTKAPEARRAHMQGRIDSFRAAYGSIVFLEDMAIVAASKEKNAMIAHMFDEWSEHTSGMHQFALWTALETVEGVGCSLQHYQFDPDWERGVMEAWKIPSAWKLRAQLVFGGVKDGGYPTDQKEKRDSSETFKMYGAEG